MKRTLDVILASFLLLAAVPVLAVLLIGSAISLRAWPFFTQERIGRGGQTFRFLKVRTLPPQTPAYTDKYQLAKVQVPRFCRLVRSLHLDELPQLLLVLSGRMSLVGPRPEMPNFHAGMNPVFAASRTQIRPGCTGLWQVSDAQGGLISEHPEFDEYYVRNRSFRLDLWILARTVVQMIPGVAHSPIRFADLPPWAPTPVFAGQMANEG